MQVAHKWFDLCDNEHAFIQSFKAAFTHPIESEAL